MQTADFRAIWPFLWSVIKPYRWYYLMMMVAPIATSFYDFANNYALKLIVDAFSLDDAVSLSELLGPIVLFISAQIVVDVVWRMSDIAEWRSEPYVRREILIRVYDHLQNNSYKFFQNTPSGVITSQVKGILDGYDNFWAAVHHEFTPRLISTLVLTATLAIVNVWVFLGVSLWAICFFVIMHRFSQTLDRLSYSNSIYRHKLLGLIADNIGNIFTVFSFATKRYETNRLTRAIDKDFTPSSIRLYKMGFLSNTVAAILYWIMLISLFFYIIYLRGRNEVTTGDLVFVLSITLKMSWEIWQLVQKMQSFMKDYGDFKSAFVLMLNRHDPLELSTGPQLKVHRPSITFDDVSFSYPSGKSVLSNLNLQIRAGEKVGLVGESGAGKSTIASLMLRNFLPTGGRILIDGQDISSVSLDSLRRNIAVIPQDIMLFHRTIFDNIRYGRLSASKEEVFAAARIASIHEYIKAMPEGYQSMVGERGIKLSGGQRQRIAIARAILKNASILILDEATSSLDTVTERLIQMSLTRLLHNSSTTVIAIAHRLSTVKNLDRIIVLDRGEIVEQGSHELLIKASTLYKKLWEMQTP